MQTTPILSLVCCLAAGCGVTRTVALQDAPRYANRDTVVTMEGYALHWDDGGQLSPAAREGLCLVDAGEGEIRVGTEYVPLQLLAGEPGVVCARNRVAAPVSVVVEDDTLTILGRKNAVRVPTQAVVGLRVHGPKNGQSVASESQAGSGPGVGNSTEANSVPLIAFGAIIMASGLAGGVAAAVVAGETSTNGWFGGLDRAGFVGLAILSFGAGLGAGIPMIAVGAKQVRLPVRAESRALPSVSLSVGGTGAAARVAF